MLRDCLALWAFTYISNLVIIFLKSLGPIDRKFYGHGKNDEFVLYEYIIKQCSSFANIQTSALWKNECQIK